MTSHPIESVSVPGSGLRPLLALAALLILACALHLGTLALMGDALEPDEAVVALMGKHILEGRSRPVFYYGQPYLGSLEAYAVAASYGLLGMEPTAARLVSLLASLGLVACVYLLGLRWGTGVALAVALAVALPPPDVLVWHLKIRGGFMLGALLTALLLLEASRTIEAPVSPLGMLRLGLVAGLACWTNQLSIPFAAVAVVAVWRTVQRRGDLGAQRGLPLLGLGCLLGALPLLVYNFVHPARSFLHLAAHYGNLELDAGPLLPALVSGLRHTVEAVPQNLAKLATDTGPRLVGGGSWPLPWAAMPALGLALLLILGFAARLRGSLRGTTDRGTEQAWPARTWLVLVALAFALFVRRNAELNQFLHVSALVPFAAVAVAPPARRRWVALAVALIALPGLVESSMGLARARLPLPPVAPHGLVAHLETHGLDYVYSEHRPAYLLAFYSGERIAASPVADFLWRRDRWPPYTRLVDDAASPAYVFEVGSENALIFETRCRSAGGHWRREEVAGYLIYDRVSCSREEVFGPLAARH